MLQDCAGKERCGSSSWRSDSMKFVESLLLGKRCANGRIYVVCFAFRDSRSFEVDLAVGLFGVECRMNLKSAVSLGATERRRRKPRDD